MLLLYNLGDVWDEVASYSTKLSQMRKEFDVGKDEDGTLKNEINHETKQYVATPIQLSIVN